MGELGEHLEAILGAITKSGWTFLELVEENGLLKKHEILQYIIAHDGKLYHRTLDFISQNLS